MDRWFMRTWGRLTGKLFKTSLENIHNSEIRLQTALDAFIKSSEANGTDINDFIKSAFGPRSAKNISLTGNNVDLKALAKAIKNASTKEERRSAFNQTPEGEELRLAGNNLAGNMNAEKLNPASGSERKFIREIFNEVLSNLHEEGYNTLTMADFQAILWYGEKRLYDSAKVADDIEGYEDSEAPDYANAAEKLARKLGVSEEVIQGAKERDTNVYDESGTKSTGQDIQESAEGVGVGDGGTERGTQANVTGFSRRERAGFLKRHIFLVERLKAVRKQEAKESGGGRNANVWVHKRKGTGGTGSVRLVEAVYTPTPALQTVLDKSEISAPTIYELTHTTENAQRFWDAIKAAKDSDSKHGAAVWLYEQSDYEGMRLFLSEDNKHGFAIKPDGDIVSAFKFKEKTDKKTDPDMRDKANWSGTANWMLTIATSEGGTKLDCFDTILPSIYRVNGFKEVRREAWDESQRVPDWNKENFAEYNNGEPDIVYMEYDPNYNPYDVNVAQTPNEGYRIAGEESDSTFKAPPVKFFSNQHFEDMIRWHRANILELENDRSKMRFALEINPEGYCKRHGIEPLQNTEDTLQAILRADKAYQRQLCRTQRIQVFLDSLSPEEEQFITMRYHKQLQWSELAEAFNVAESTVKKRWRQKLLDRAKKIMVAEIIKNEGW